MTDHTSGHLDPILRYQMWTALHEERLEAARLARERAALLPPAPSRPKRRRALFRRAA